LRFCHPWKKWLIWDGTRWRVDDTGEIYRRAKGVIDLMWEDVPLITDAREQQEYVKHVRASSQSRGIAAMVALSQSERGIPVLPQDLDQDPNLLNCPNGTVDLRTGEIWPHLREDMLTKCTAVNFNPEAKSPVWDEFLISVFDENGELIRFCQRFFGYALSGVIREHVLAVFQGDGANGKSTLIEALLHAIGPDYSTKAAPDLLLVKGDAHPTERADLFGKRFVAAVETGADRNLNEALVKELTGGDTQKARRMREDFWSFPQT